MTLDDYNYAKARRDYYRRVVAHFKDTTGHYVDKVAEWQTIMDMISNDMAYKQTKGNK